MGSSDARGWIIASLIIAMIIGFAFFTIARARTVEVYEYPVAAEMMVDDSYHEHEELHSKIDEYEARIHAYEQELQRLKRDR